VNEAERGELRMIAAREIVSLAGCAVLLLMLHPGVHRWVEHQAWRLRQQARRREVAEDAAVAELRRDISRYEHGEVTW
jgi:uncharacterized iron-regulated membrane protein